MAHVPVQAPAVQVREATWLLEQAPHPPQWSTSELVNTSHPLDDVPSQSAVPALHVIPQEPLKQPPTALDGDGQALLQLPQCWALVRRSTSQPSPTWLLQFP